MKIKKAVIPVAGMGTRFLPITKSIAKEMLPIVDQPAIHKIVKECMDSGIEEIIFITSSTKKSIEDYFSKNNNLEEILDEDKKELIEETNEIISNIKFHFVEQIEATGSATAIALARDFIKDEFFAVLYGDDLMDCKTPALSQLINLNKETNRNIIGCLEVEKELITSYGIMKLDKNNEIKGIIEKPSIEEAPSNIAGLGRYIVHSDIFDCIDNLKMDSRGEYNFTDAMELLREKNDNFTACIIDGTYYDIGSKFGYLKANIMFGLKHKEVKDELNKFLKEKV